MQEGGDNEPTRSWNDSVNKQKKKKKTKLFRHGCMPFKKGTATRVQNPRQRRTDEDFVDIN